MASSTPAVLRTLAALTLALGSVLAGLILAFKLVTPAQVAHLPTLELLGLLGLLVLPPLTLWAGWAEHTRHANGAPTLPDRMIEIKPFAAASIRTASASERHAPPTHRRRAHASAGT